MDQRNLLTQALEFIKTQRQYRWWLRAVTGMAAVVVFVTTYLLILPAITMENSVLEVTATPSEAVLGEVIETEIFALADDGREETYFVLTADGDNAGLDESQLDFDSDGIASIEDTNGQVIDLHREYTEAGEARYWFVLQEGQSASFSLPWVNGMDRYRAEEVAEEVPVEPEEPPVEEEIPPTEEPSEGETPPDDTGMEETIPPESDTEPENPDGETPPAETAEPGTDAPPQDEPDADVPDTDTPDTEPGEPDTDSIETARRRLRQNGRLRNRRSRNQRQWRKIPLHRLRIPGARKQNPNRIPWHLTATQAMRRPVSPTSIMPASVPSGRWGLPLFPYLHIMCRWWPLPP